MASLKDMRIRIASVKATQKITKAMQMVAAASCAARRSGGGRPALCRAHGRGDRQPGGRRPGEAGAPPLLAGTG